MVDIASGRVNLEVRHIRSLCGWLGSGAVRRGAETPDNSCHRTSNLLSNTWLSGIFLSMPIVELRPVDHVVTMFDGPYLMVAWTSFTKQRRGLAPAWRLLDLLELDGWNLNQRVAEIRDMALSLAVPSET